MFSSEPTFFLCLNKPLVRSFRVRKTYINYFEMQKLILIKYILDINGSCQLLACLRAWRADRYYIYFTAKPIMKKKTERPANARSRRPRRRRFILPRL